MNVQAKQKPAETHITEVSRLSVGRYQVWKSMDRERYEQFVENIRVNGIQNAIHVDEDYVILDGHHRYRAAIDCGLELVPVMRHLALTDEEKEGHAYFLNTLGRDISKKEKQEAAVTLRRAGKSYRLIGAWLGISYGTAVNWTKEAEGCSGDQKLTPEQTADSADGKSYPATLASTPAITERAERIQAAHESGLTIRDIAQQEGVSVGTVHADLKREIVRGADAELDEEETQITAKPTIDMRIFELIEYAARTSAEVKEYGELPLGPDRSLLRFFHESLRPFVGNLSMSVGDFTRATDELAKELYMEQMGFMAEISLRMLIEHDYDRAEKIMEAIANG
ncbi:DNA methylase N-4/N-6 domain-containing protein [Paenibacillus sp. FSL R7-269]|uniref:ParB/RepB/Spo0J family partition protein n=1 Tax=Paenibacillus sp. FSL R7-269 TaxID=1226755 RepID=UPI0003E2AD56|nr:ParB/RepB/Spo0J family partition protein [Paenibacillus sp. FSL R7-269]ETT40928.1 DNA methylase N-4/N-6 domain-containing protein [Paenibacillus sp. FSL R7-269]